MPRGRSVDTASLGPPLAWEFHKESPSRLSTCSSLLNLLSFKGSYDFSNAVPEPQYSVLIKMCQHSGKETS